MLDDGTIIIAVRPDEAKIKAYSMTASSRGKGAVFKVEIVVTDEFAVARLLAELETSQKSLLRGSAR